MSGGSFDYAYSKLYELRRWVETLDAMAGRCREWASDPSVQAREKDEASGFSRPRPATFEERAWILLRGLLLERAAKRLSGAIGELEGLEQIMHDVEWVASCDYGVDDLMKPVGEVKHV